MLLIKPRQELFAAVVFCDQELDISAVREGDCLQRRVAVRGQETVGAEALVGGPPVQALSSFSTWIRLANVRDSFARVGNSTLL